MWKSQFPPFHLVKEDDATTGVRGSGHPSRQTTQPPVTDRQLGGTQLLCPRQSVRRSNGRVSLIEPPFRKDYNALPRRCGEIFVLVRAAEECRPESGWWGHPGWHFLSEPSCLPLPSAAPCSAPRGYRRSEERSLCLSYEHFYFNNQNVFVSIYSTPVKSNSNNFSLGWIFKHLIKGKVVKKSRAPNWIRTRETSRSRPWW